LGWLLGPSPKRFTKAWWLKEVRILFIIGVPITYFLIRTDHIIIRLRNEEGEFDPSLHIPTELDKRMEEGRANIDRWRREAEEAAEEEAQKGKV